LIVREYAGETSRYEACNADDVIVVLDSLLEEDMELEGISRELTNRIQKLRKSAGLLATDEGVRVYYSFNSKQKKEGFFRIVEKTAQFYWKDLLFWNAILSLLGSSFS